MSESRSFIHRKHPSAPTGDNPRLAALNLLRKLDAEEKTLDQLIDDQEADFAFTDRRNRALLNILVFGTIRHRSRLDWHIRRFSKIQLEKMHQDILHILRLALYQLLYLDKIPASAAVHTAVELAKSRSRPGVDGFVNAVLRAFIREKDRLKPPESDPDPLIALSEGRSFPEWMIRRWLKRFGAAETARLCDELNQIPPVTLRTNALLTTRPCLMEKLALDVEVIEPATLSAQGVHVSGFKTPLRDWESYRRGWFQVQDEAAQLITGWLDPRPGETVLDACAGMGGKAMHIAELMQNQGAVLALDKISVKLERLNIEAQRIGVCNIVKTQACDLEQPEQLQKLPTDFDKIIIDAPCSGLGVIRRNPDIKWRKSENSLPQYARRQALFLKHLAPLLKVGGILMYCVCSLEPEETTQVIASFLRHHPEFAIVRAVDQLQPQFAALIDAQGFFWTFPHHTHTDGFFAVKLIKNENKA